ncbi:hypothetical protein GCM10022239_03150 [Leifsonia bigeumensis]|uniref:DUF2470 domain-containing protein n=1 Tax=Leifsonella bigeumensis TaxID=433643 RepID=A0ABP7F314_9MICO
MPIFEADVVTAVLKHMNDDHNDDNLLIARAFGHPDADSATMTGLDGLGGFWGYTIGDDAHELGVPWSGPISARPEIRREIVVLYDAACARLGVEPRPHA